MNFHALNTYANAFSELFFPRVCRGCGEHLSEHEAEVCGSCLRSLPRTGFESVDDNLVSQMFWGRVKIEKAASLYYYRKGELLQKLLHKLKYRGIYQIGEVFGIQIGTFLLRAGFTTGIDMIIPVPLHKIKHRERGYNQSEHIAEGISEIVNIPVVAGNLVRTVHSASQTRKSRFERWENVSSIFAVRNPGMLKGKHILLIDDVVTTGATLEACARTLMKVKDVKVSIATIGYADI